MTLPTSGPISLSAIQTEFGGSNPIGLGEYYEGGAYVQSDNIGLIPTSGLNSLSNYYGAVNIIPKGYFGGGYGPITAEIDGILFSNDTAFNPTATLAAARYGLAGVNSSTKGYFGGGNTGTNSAEIDGILFSDDTAFNPTATLAVARQASAGVNSGSL